MNTTEETPRLEELFNLMLDEAPVMFTPKMKPYIIELAKRYATECSQASLEKASEKAKIEKEYSIKYQDFIPDGVDKESITNPDNIILK